MSRQGALPFAIAFVLPLTVVAGWLGGGAWNLSTVVLTFVIVPLLDFAFGRDTRNVGPDEEPRAAEERSYRVLTHAAAPLQLALTVWGAWVVARGEMSALELTGFVLSIGTSNGALGITVAHELVHRTAALERWLGRALLVTVGYTHWGLEHVAGHHATVATPQDPATARLGEPLYAFWPRTVFGGFAGAWRLEVKRLARAEETLWGMQNRMIQSLGAQFLFMMALGIFCGPLAIPFYFLQGVAAFTLLEIVNYIEHYGLERRKTGPGQWERVTPLHSWNASNRLTNYFLFNLQRHADHHFNAGRRYQLLRHHDESPQLPTGYAGMIVLALVPPLWFKVMDPRVAGHRQRLVEAAAEPDTHRAR